MKVMFTKEKNVFTVLCYKKKWLKLLLVENLKSLVSLMETDFCEQDENRHQSEAVEQ